MNVIDKLYENFEDARVHYVGFVSNDCRYDFAIVYTSHFFGKTLVIDMQQGRSMLLDSDDIHDMDQFCKIFNHCNIGEFEVLRTFLEGKIPSLPNAPQY